MALDPAFRNLPQTRVREFTRSSPTARAGVGARSPRNQFLPPTFTERARRCASTRGFGFDRRGVKEPVRICIVEHAFSRLRHRAANSTSGVTKSEFVLTKQSRETSGSGRHEVRGLSPGSVGEFERAAGGTGVLRAFVCKYEVSTIYTGSVHEHGRPPQRGQWSRKLAVGILSRTFHCCYGTLRLRSRSPEPRKCSYPLGGKKEVSNCHH